MELKSFRVEKLHGVYDFELKFQNNTLILVGENGSGKSTLMKMLFYTLSHQWAKLSQYKFDLIVLYVNNEIIEVTHSLLDFSRNDQRINLLPKKIKQAILNGESLSSIENECRKYQYPFSYIMQIMNNIHKSNTQLREKSTIIKNALDGIHILYLPTYRRIENDLNVILSNRIGEEREDIDFHNNIYNIQSKEIGYSEIAEFGMDDVKNKVLQATSQLRTKFTESLNKFVYSYMNETLSREFEYIDLEKVKQIKKQDIIKVLNRIYSDSYYLPYPKRMVEAILNIVEKREVKKEDMVAYHYFTKLLNTINMFEYEEDDVTYFVKICNQYLTNKSLNYNTSEFTLKVKKGDQILDWNHLSSGEKQIVSLFSLVNLEKDKKFFVMIDEPELSLSISWQKSFLEDIYKGKYSAGVFAVTHSPFIFENDLDMYAHGINEFVLTAE